MSNRKSKPMVFHKICVVRNGLPVGYINGLTLLLIIVNFSSLSRTIMIIFLKDVPL